MIKRLSTVSFHFMCRLLTVIKPQANSDVLCPQCLCVTFKCLWALQNSSPLIQFWERTFYFYSHISMNSRYNYMDAHHNQQGSWKWSVQATVLVSEPSRLQLPIDSKLHWQALSSLEQWNFLVIIPFLVLYFLTCFPFSSFPWNSYLSH